MLIVIHDFCLIKKTRRLQQGFWVGPRTKECCNWFQILCQWLELEADAELYSLTEPHAKMVEFSGGSDVYTLKRLKQKLHEHYEDFVFFAEVDGRGTVLCFRNMASYIIINDKW